jgi:hypothetical protein
LLIYYIMKTQRKYSRVHKKRALTHKKRKLSKKTLKRKNKKSANSKRSTTKRRKSRKHKKRGGKLTKTRYGVGSSLVDFPSAVEEEEVYGFKEMCAPGYQLVEESVGDGSKDKIYTCVEDNRQLGEIQNSDLAKKPELTFKKLEDVAGVLY